MRLLLSCFLVLFTQTLQAQEFPGRSFQLVNSLYDEQNPVITPDGTTLFFTIGNHPQNVGGKKDPGDIWFSRWVDNEWSAPVHAGSLLNNKMYNAVAGFSSNGKQLFLHGHYTSSGNPVKTQGISVSADTGHGWSKPVNIVIPYFLNKSAIVSGTISDDGSVFVFSAETYGTHGVDDIYVSLKNGTKWSEPKNVGTTVNTQFQEVSPSLSADGKTLYFSGNGRKGSGSFDVYSCERLDDTWMNWSTPRNLGETINSEGRDLYFRSYPSTGYALFTSTTNSDGYGDIKIFRPDEGFLKKDSTIVLQQPAQDTLVKIVEVKHGTANAGDNRVTVYGKVVNSKTGEPVKAKVSFSAPAFAGQNAIATESGYTISIPSTEQYTISIEAQGYISAIQKLDINTYEMKQLEMNFTLQPVEVGATVNLKNVLFAQTKSDILPESYPELDLVVNFLKANPSVKIELTGHTDNRGVHADNVRLSQQRVNSVKEYLVANGIDSKRISGRGFGGTRPIASNDTEQSRRMNRRVEFTIKKF